ncbi:DUF4919 domain-containing protein [Flavobacterium sp.]|uniref:DUF4919 domain-containing protein n=1 Tax=Flavobacterium sp. TaxID=239 RepID=UPI001225D192|nr:DUF4919 domain-containing protein [Flavobacterium sp.]RZJ71832.1 MAG: DUF4919 domain-containing protein [Flavobacterium sp.]
MRNLFFALFGFVSFLVSAQVKSEKPNYDKIEKAIADKTSEFYYPTMFGRFKKGDTTLTIQQKRHLYYGFQFQPNYNPYGVPKEMEELRPLLKNREMSDADALKVSTLVQKILAKNPFDIKMMNVLLYATEKTKETAVFNATLNQMAMVIDALGSSGDGKTKQTAFYVISVSDEYQLLAVLKLQPAGKQSLVEHYDYLEVAANPDNIKGLYFDVTASMGAMVKSVKDKK